MELKIDHITKEFQGVAAVDQVTLTFGCGVYGLLGANGAGKTTLMRILCTLLKPTGGNITWDGLDIFKMGMEYRKLLGYLPQDFGYYPDFTVKDYLCYIASIKGVRPDVTKRLVSELLGKVGLSKEQNKKMKKLSGGMKRRAGIAQAIINDPRILILDEPTAGLDPNERIRFRKLLSELAQDRLVLLSTHIVTDVESIANEILLMKSGQIIQSGTPGEITGAVPQKAWKLTVPVSETDFFLKRYKVTNIKTMKGNAELRILSEEMPHPSAAEEEMNLEDVFLYYFDEKAGDHDAAL